MEPLIQSGLAALLLSLRIAPSFVFAPPFTLLRTPPVVRVILSYGLALWMLSAAPQAGENITMELGALIGAGVKELLLGAWFTLSLQIAFASLLLVGRTIDFQVGFGLALIADPTLRTQMPLVGSLFAYGAGAIFFAINGPADLLMIWSQSLNVIPIGAYERTSDIAALLTYMGASLSIALGLAGLIVVIMFLLDTALAFLSRTLPQMNVLVLGFQVKTIVLLMTLPILFATSSAMFLKLVRYAIDSTPRLI